jgi:signal transduction histidine kinase
MNKKLEEVIEKKDKFFSILAHDLRNQVGSLYMATKMINEALEIPENSTRRKLSNSIVQTAAQTYNLLEDLLYWAIRQFKKDVAIMKVKTDVNRIILDLSDTFRLNNDNIAIQCNLCPNADIVSDRQILGFIIRNIVHNAIKYSFKNGHIIIATSRTNGSIRISVRDFGVGMSPEIVNSIYAGTPIRKEGKTIATTTGLGLSTALEFLKMLNGSIQINSAPNEGTEFIVLLQKMEEDNMADSNS